MPTREYELEVENRTLHGRVSQLCDQLREARSELEKHPDNRSPMAQGSSEKSGSVRQAALTYF